jgi:hypothetical protein
MSSPAYADTGNAGWLIGSRLINYLVNGFFGGIIAAGRNLGINGPNLSSISHT